MHLNFPRFRQVELSIAQPTPPGHVAGTYALQEKIGPGFE